VGPVKGVSEVSAEVDDPSQLAGWADASIYETKFSIWLALAFGENRFGKPSPIIPAFAILDVG
jgi:hypothetical protein